MLAALAAPLPCPTPAAARERPQPIQSMPIRLEATTLTAAIALIAQRGGLEIVSLEPRIAAVPVVAQVLPADPVAALKALLNGTGYRAVRTGPRSFRVERPHAAPPPRPAPPRLAALPTAPPAPLVAATPADITVVAGKFPTRLADYPGSVVRLPSGSGPVLPGRKLDDLGRESPVVFSTAFGDGRDKFFIRGIADSSFNGAAQPTTAIYLDDAPISIGSPNPNLRLYDVAAIEVLEGPQGTLYGAGSIGGAIRIVSRPVELDRASGSASAEADVVGGRIGGNLSGALNLPLVTDRAGLRVVGYGERAAGYIDDPVLGAALNRIDVAGGRAAFAAEPTPGLRIELGGLYQQTRAHDAQYADGSAGPGSLTRRPAVAQPYRNDLALGRLAVRQRWDDGLELDWQFSLGHRTSRDRFDASQNELSGGALVYDQQRSATALGGEVRLGRQSAAGLSWVLGVNAQQITDGQSRAFGMGDSPPVLDDVTNRTRSVSGFVQGRFPLAARLSATLGLRYTAARTDSEPGRGARAPFVRGQTASRLDPTLALLWRASERIAVFARYQTGYRNGGVTVARGIGRVSDFAPDTIEMVEAGLRRSRIGDTGLELSAAVSAARWRNILAELITRRGTPVTTNIGNARVVAVEGAVDWVGSAGWRLGASALYTANWLTGELAMQSVSPDRRLPDTPQVSARLAGGREWRLDGDNTLSVDATARYVGRSVLGPGTLFDRSQGDYTVVDLRAQLRRKGVTGWLGVANLLDSHANRFAMGNPMLLYLRQGYAPLAPRRISLGLSAAY